MKEARRRVLGVEDSGLPSPPPPYPPPWAQAPDSLESGHNTLELDAIPVQLVWWDCLLLTIGLSFSLQHLFRIAAPPPAPLHFFP